MNSETQQRLLDINRSFYTTFAAQFAGSRSSGQASLRRVLAGIQNGASVLDAGCGDGKVARALAEMERQAGYTGVDSSSELLDLARERSRELAEAVFVLADLTSADWLAALPRRTFDWALALAVLHHLPGEDLRLRVLQQLAALLAPDGRMVVSTWQFLASDRLRQKIVPWSKAGLTTSDVDAGDYLLDRQRGGYGLRYCRFINESELRGLLQAAGLVDEETFLEDNGLNLYAVARRQ